MHSPAYLKGYELGKSEHFAHQYETALARYRLTTSRQAFEVGYAKGQAERYGFDKPAPPPLAALRYHISGAIARGEAQAIAGIPAAAMETAQSATLKREARKTLAQAEVTGFTCTICGRTGFDRPTAHGCLNKANQWRAPRHTASARRS